MSEYNDFPPNFITRTLENLKNYTGIFEVTNLINNCLGLIIIPRQKLKSQILAYSFDDVNSDYGITRKNISNISKRDYSLSNVLRHIRNGLAHGRIEQKSENGVIIGLRIHDKTDESAPENFAIYFTIDEFRRFAISISEMFLIKPTKKSSS